MVVRHEIISHQALKKPVSGRDSTKGTAIIAGSTVIAPSMVSRTLRGRDWSGRSAVASATIPARIRNSPAQPRKSAPIPCCSSAWA